jgi:hypothetical protein
MEYIAVLNTSDFITLIRHGYLEDRQGFRYSNKQDFQFLLINSDPFRYEFDKLFVKCRAKELQFANIISFHPLTLPAKQKMEDDFPWVSFSDPLYKIDLNEIFRLNRGREIKQIRNYLSDKLSVPVARGSFDLSALQQERQDGKVNPLRRSMIETTILFNETDNYQDSDIKYFMRFGEIYVMSQKDKPGSVFQKSDAFKEWEKLEVKNQSFDDLSNKAKQSAKKFESTIINIGDEFADVYFEVIPRFLKFKELVDQRQYKESLHLVKPIQKEKAKELLIHLISGLYNFNIVKEIFHQYKNSTFVESDDSDKKKLDGGKTNFELEITNENKITQAEMVEEKNKILGKGKLTPTDKAPPTSNNKKSDKKKKSEPPLKKRGSNSKNEKITQSDNLGTNKKNIPEQTDLFNSQDQE